MSSATPARGTALALAEEAYERVQADPQAAAVLAERALAAARAERSVRAELTALHALAWSQHVLGDVRAARTARTGIRLGVEHGDRQGAALLRRRLALTLAFAGDNRGARREIDAAVADLTGVEAARSEVFRVAIHRSAHSVDPFAHRMVLSQAARALRRLRKEGDSIWEARLLFNRGALFSDRGELDSAEKDLRRARAIYVAAGADAAAADATVAIAELALLRGDIVEYLRTSDEHRARLPPGTTAVATGDYRAAAFAQARLLPEARAAAGEYIELCLRSGRGGHAAAAMLDAAAISLLSGDSAEAVRTANRSARLFAARGRPVNAALARIVALRARLLDGSLLRSSIRIALEQVAILETAGWRRHALRARIVAARVALALSSAAVAREQLELAQPLARRGTRLDQIDLAHARALLELSDGDSAAAERFLRRGLGLLEEYRAGFGAVELRATSSGIGVELTQLGLRISLDSGEPARVLSWAERLRGNALRLPPVRPPSDHELRDRQVELRRLADQIRESEQRGAPVRGLATRQAELESAIRSRSRYVQGDGGAVLDEVTRRDADRALAGRAFLEYVELEGELHALTLAGGRLSLHELTGGDAISELEWLRFALAQLARGGTSNAQRQAALANARATAASLDGRLLEPLMPSLGDAPLVVVPTGPLHALPWSALPSLRGRPVVVAPSLSTWIALDARPQSRRRRVVFVGGPRLRHATREVRTVAPLRPHAEVLLGREATVEAALASLDGARLAHVACHGRFRADSPLFSSLELADGPLTALDLQQLERVPRTLILSSCDLALSERHPGDELLGFSAALLAMGTRTIVASVVPIPDAAARRLMFAFHRALVTGSSPSVALARAQAGLRGDLTALAGFVCLGSD